MPMDRSLYPDDWEQISHRIRFERAKGRCEGSPDYPDCRAVNGFEHPDTDSIVVLTVAHLDHDPANCNDDNLRAWCQRCHNHYDAPMRAANRKRKQLQLLKNAGQLPLLDVDET